ncbi:MAG: hypothetical protein WCP21_02320 [Armatimonadota bacterium]
MSRTTVATMLCLLGVGLVVGLLLGSHPSLAAAQDAPAAAAAPATDVKALLAPSPVVSAVPYQSRTDYEQDPFETTRLRRTTTTVQRLVLVHADGSMDLKETP